MTALSTYEAFLDELLEVMGFVSDAVALRTRIRAAVVPDLAKTLQPQLDSFAARRPLEERVWQAFLVSAHGGFEQFLAGLVDDVCVQINNSRLSPVELEKRFPSIIRKYLRASGGALTSVFSPRGHWKLDFERISSSIGTTVQTSDVTTIEGRVFIVEARSLSAEELVRQFDVLGIRVDWDNIGRLPEMQAVLGVSGTRATAKAIKERLGELTELRNSHAHSQGALSISMQDLDSAIRFYRALSGYLSSSALTQVRATLGKRS